MEHTSLRMSFAHGVLVLCSRCDKDVKQKQKTYDVILNVFVEFRKNKRAVVGDWREYNPKTAR